MSIIINDNIIIHGKITAETIMWHCTRLYVNMLCRILWHLLNLGIIVLLGPCVQIEITIMCKHPNKDMIS